MSEWAGAVGNLAEGLRLQPLFDVIGFVEEFAVPIVVVIIWFFIHRVSQSVKRLTK